jgi:hypothetical protein
MVWASDGEDKTALAVAAVKIVMAARREHLGENPVLSEGMPSFAFSISCI